MQEQQKLELIDIYDISYQPWWLSFWFRISLGLLLGMLVLVGVYYVIRRRRTTVVLTYTQKALHNLHLLEKQGFGDGQQFYVRLTQVMKEYLQQRYALPLADKTDSELITTLKATPSIAPEVVKDVKNVFEGMMFIKFAHQQAAQERMEHDLALSRALIEVSQKQDEQQK